MVTHSVLHQFLAIPFAKRYVTDVWKKLDYRKVKFLTIDFTGFSPKPLVTQLGVLNFQRCKELMNEQEEKNLLDGY